MRSLRTAIAVAFAALLTLIGAGPAAAAKKPKASAFAAKYHLTGSWKTKDTDKDGLKNFKEFKLGTNPKSADTDKDGLKDADEVESGNDPTDRDTDGDGTKDGAEHAGVITAFDGETITIKEFATGKKVTATLDTDCTAADGATADDSSVDDDGYVDTDDDDSLDGDFTADASTADDDGVEEDVDLGDDDADASSSCDDSDLEKGAVLTSAELEKDGGVTYLVDYDLA
jgi:hypothetical protein